ncbi:MULTISPECIES: hypothetical protein [Calothrix]|uniref:Uncharacterized protein n=2 Tax=Calothrix TaxID=1186 RepID=A0ABR8AL43_9CYAN|nr:MULTISPECIES: hypothetical protein [Calothrix]MBD2200796.1 hypothetical protein [Calothrix parietina FACHB-288]MBD2225572.1 hypothetical protein [Calothrix anomala FACHB-343]
MRKIGFIFLTVLSISAVNYHAIAQISPNKPLYRDINAIEFLYKYCGFVD